jgi:putative nucleotidyltransferase with HDIG domain
VGAYNGTTDHLSTLIPADWRPLAPPVALTSEPITPISFAAGPQLHLTARRGSAALERARARQIVDIAKSRIADAFQDIRFGKGLDVEPLWPIVSGVAASIKRHPGAVMSVTRIKDRDDYVYMHSIAVCGLMINLARRLGLDPALDHDIGLAGLLHDVGKAAVPAKLLNLPGPLSEKETDVVRSHCESGHATLATGNRLPDIVLDVVLHHHERLDGSGYPKGLDRESLSVFARMAAICDVYDAVTSLRAHKAAWSPARAIDWMTSAPDQFDKQILAPFAAMIGIFPVGTLVRLQSGRLAIVLDDPDGDPTKPPVCPFYCIMTQRSLPWRYSPAAIDPIVGIERPSRWNFPEWEALRDAIVSDVSPPAAVD